MRCNNNISQYDCHLSYAIFELRCSSKLLYIKPNLFQFDKLDVQKHNKSFIDLISLENFDRIMWKIAIHTTILLLGSETCLISPSPPLPLL